MKQSNNIIDKAFSSFEELVEHERFEELKSQVKAGSIKCQCGHIFSIDDMSTFDVKVGYGVKIGEDTVWVHMNCFECGNVENWRNVMDRHGI